MSQRLVRFGALASLAAAAAGCTLGRPDVVPFRGPAPRSVLVLPSAGDLRLGLARAIAARGYRTPADAVGERMVVDAGLVPPTGTAWDVERIGRELQVDAVLELEARDFTASGEPLARARWDLVWRLRATRDGAVLWQFDHHGAWTRPRDSSDPLRPFDAEPEPVPLFERPEPVFRSAGELTEWLHRLAMAHLPECPPAAAGGA